MFTSLKTRLTLGAALVLTGTGAFGASIALDTGDATNGLTDIFSATFDGALSPCTGSDPGWCSFFGGKPGTSRAIVISPNPSGISTATPGGITGAGPGSFLNLNINGSNLELTGGTIAFPAITLTIAGTTTVTPSGTAGFVLNPGIQSAAINGDGQAEFLVNLAPNLAADFSTFSSIVGPADCTGSLCALIPILSLDMVRYRLFIDLEPDLSGFTGTFIGQTANNSLLFANLNSTSAVPVPAAGWLLVPAVAAVAARARRRKA
jgi:hypothetical protein